MRQILATTGLCTLALLAACSDDSKGGGHDAGGGDDDSGAQPGAGGGSDGGGGAGAGGGAAGAGDGGGAGGAADGGGGAGDGGGGAGGADAGDGGDQQAACDPSKAPDVGKLKVETVISGLELLLDAAQPPGSKDWYLVQQRGKIVILPDGSDTTMPFLDVSSEISLRAGSDDERGLLGLAFAPDFATSGLFYVMMTTTADNVDRVRQYKKGSAAPELKQTILVLPGSDVNHNGGNVIFGPDGMLYVGTGDGGGSCNSAKPDAPQLISSDPNSVFGKILRLDPANTSGNFAAAGNPFPESPLVWQYGLRNPYRFSFDRETGDLYIGDVGQDSYEELDFAKAGVSGLNFGWAAYEAKTMTCGGRKLRTGTTQTEPIFVADRRKAGCTGQFCDWVSVIGGFVYRGKALPQLKGTYIFGDYNGERMVALRQCDTGTSPITVIRKNRAANEPNTPYLAAGDFPKLKAMVEDNDGELYFITNDGAFRKLVPGP
jgi:glucose/arabinose dehydrogenase